jgi:leucyl aminopeptidase
LRISIKEPLWRLPVSEEHFKLMKGQHSDLCNIGKGKFEGSQKAAAFLLSFLDKEKVG